MSKTIAKELRKEVRDAQRMAPTPEVANVPRPAKMLKTFPKRTTSTAKNRALILEGIKAKKAKSKKKKSRRTTPGKTENYAFATHTTNVEGKRWLQTIQKQTLQQAKSLVKKLFKRG